MSTNDKTQDDLIEFSSSWVKRAIAALLDAPDFQANAKWISEKLNISMDYANESFNWLLQKQFIQKTEFGFRTTGGSSDDLINIGVEQLSRKQLIDLYLKIRADLTSKLTPSNIHQVAVILTDQDLMKDFLKKYNALIDTTHSAGLAKGCSNVVAIDLAIPRLSAPKATTQESLQDTLFQAAHDIRGPLSALNMISHAMKSNGVDGHLNEFLEQTISHINAIASEILNVKKEFHLNHLSNSTDFFDLELFEDELYKAVAKDTRANINMNVLPIDSTKNIVSGNLTQLHRIIRNIFQNALDAKADAIIYESRIENEYLKITIKDNGVGFPKEILGMLGKEGFTTKPEGNGLGLFYAIQNVEKWGGAISFVDAKKGACIEIKLKILSKTRQKRR